MHAFHSALQQFDGAGSGVVAAAGANQIPLQRLSLVKFVIVFLVFVFAFLLLGNENLFMIHTFYVSFARSQEFNGKSSSSSMELSNGGGGMDKC